MDRRIVKKQGKYFTQEEQHAIIQEMITNGCSKKEIWKKYTGQEEEHGQLLRWMKKLGYPIVGRTIRTNFDHKSEKTPAAKNPDSSASATEKKAPHSSSKSGKFPSKTPANSSP